MSVPCVPEHDPAEARRLFTFEALERSYRECRRRKRGTRNALRFEKDLEANLLELAGDLQSGRYQPRRSVCFIFILKVTRNHTIKAWYAHLDIRSFFASIDHERLLDLLARRSPSPTVQWLCERIMRRDIASDAVLRGPKHLFDRVPPGKSLLRAPAGSGLPIGNHTSQFFANVYLNRLDQFVKHELRARFYIRYVDDLVLLSPRREELAAWQAAIDGFLRENLLLELNESRSRIAPLSSGVDFLGYVVHPHHTLVRRRVVRSLTGRLSRLEKALTEERGGYSWILYRPEESEYLRAMAASYRAHFARANTERLGARIRERFPWLPEALGGPGGNPFWTGRRLFPSLGAQAHWLDARFPGALLAIQVGRFFEFYGPRAEEVSRVARLKLIRGRRAGYRGWTRLPVERLPYLLEAARRAGIPRIVIAREAEAGASPVIPRIPAAAGRIREGRCSPSSNPNLFPLRGLGPIRSFWSTSPGSCAGSVMDQWKFQATIEG